MLPDIEWLGYREDKEHLYRQADLVVLRSYREGVSRVLPEAASCVLPLIGTDAPGCREPSRGRSQIRRCVDRRFCLVVEFSG